ncbi:hypothetical protein ASZ90_011376 [hydrocarbon metagenome]|uniref:DUF1616 domain-containing protein n=1 Tax=hydrocarbon metagenome TaxID=938273 RepID=A0A0W8FE64_9ZZZZ|nr:DUF1616 domain-containing protein [Methanomicrobiaceae archaeon]
MDPVGFILGVLQAVFGFILILFIPGYALTWALYPRQDELTFSARMAISLTLSLAAVILTVLFIDLVLGVDTTPLNIAISLLVLSGLAAGLWKAQVAYPEWAAKKRFGSRLAARLGLLKARIEPLRSALTVRKQGLLRFLLPAEEKHDDR